MLIYSTAYQLRPTEPRRRGQLIRVIQDMTYKEADGPSKPVAFI